MRHRGSRSGGGVRRTDRRLGAGVPDAAHPSPRCDGGRRTHGRRRARHRSIVIENRPGGGGNLGAEAIAKAPPDGYTIGLIQLGNVAINPHIYADMPFDPLNDLVPVAPVTTSPILVVANARVAANDLRELIALAKQSPGKLSYGSGGAGTAPHLAGEMFK